MKKSCVNCKHEPIWEKHELSNADIATHYGVPFSIVHGDCKITRKQKEGMLVDWAFAPTMGSGYGEGCSLWEMSDTQAKRWESVRDILKTDMEEKGYHSTSGGDYIQRIEKEHRTEITPANTKAVSGLRLKPAV